jgi:GNAT superfamily N-acetyltransferase
MEIEVLDRRQVSDRQARTIAELLCAVWPKPQSNVAARAAEFRSKWEDYGGLDLQFPRSFLLRESDRVVGHAEVGPRTIGTTCGELTIAALVSVCIDPKLRQQGLGRHLVRTAFQLIDDEVYSFSLFQNYAERRAFYERLGARVVDNPIVNSLAENPQLNPFWADLAMVYPATKTWPSGEVDLRGPGY